MLRKFVLMTTVPLLILLVSCEEPTKSNQSRAPSKSESVQHVEPAKPNQSHAPSESEPVQYISKEKLIILSEIRDSMNNPDRAYAAVNSQDNELKITWNDTDIQYLLRLFVISHDKVGIKRILNAGFDTLVIEGRSDSFGRERLVARKFSISRILEELEDIGYSAETGYQGLGTVHLINPPY